MQWEDLEFGGIRYDGGGFQYEFLDDIRSEKWKLYFQEPEVIKILEE